MNKTIRGIVIWILIIIALYAMVQLYTDNVKQPAAIDVTELYSQIIKNNVSEMTISGTSITGTLKDGTEFSSNVPDVTSFMNFLTPYIKDNKLVVKSEPPQGAPWWYSLLPTKYHPELSDYRQCLKRHQ